MPTATPTATLTPNVAPQIEVLEFDRNIVVSDLDLSTRVKPGEEFETRVRGRDDDGNMSYMALEDEDGTVLAREDCSAQQGSQCTVILRLIAPDSGGRLMEFYAVAVDSRGESSDRVLLQAETRKTSRSGGGSSGSSGSSGGNVPPPTPTPTPTPIPRPVLTISDGRTLESETSFHEIILNVARRGVAGFDIIFVIDDPMVARIVSVTFAPDFGLTNEELIQVQIGTTSGNSLSPAVYEVHLFAADAAQLVTDGMVEVLFAVVELRAEPLPEGVSSKQTSLRLSKGLLGIQDDDDGTPIDVEMQSGVLVVN